MPGVRASASTELVAIGSRDLERAQTVAREFDIPRAYGSYEDVLADPEVDAVYIPLPNSMHTEWTIAAAQAGKHVLCEKPLARTERQARQMAEACEGSGVVLMEAFMWRHHTQQARVRGIIASGDIGEPRMVRGIFSYVIAPDPTNVRLQEGLEGGSLMDVGCYPVNVARWVFGAEPTEVVGHQIVDAQYGVEIAFSGVLHFPGERQAQIASSFLQADQQEYEIIGTEGRLVVDRAYRPDNRPGRITIVRRATQCIEEVEPANQYALEADHFAASVRAGRPLPPGENGIAQTRVIEALYTSAATGRSVSLD